MELVTPDLNCGDPFLTNMDVLKEDAEVERNNELAERMENREPGWTRKTWKSRDRQAAGNNEDVVCSACTLHCNISKTDQNNKIMFWPIILRAYFMF